jgi:hypothetical protein
MSQKGILEWSWLILVIYCCSGQYLSFILTVIMISVSFSRPVNPRRRFSNRQVCPSRIYIFWGNSDGYWTRTCPEWQNRLMPRASGVLYTRGRISTKNHSFSRKFLYILDGHTYRLNFRYFRRRLDKNWVKANIFWTCSSFWCAGAIIGAVTAAIRQKGIGHESADSGEWCEKILNLIGCN